MSITVITGPPGAGKTTISGLLARSRPLAVHLEVDVAFHWIVSGFIPPWMAGAGPQNITVTQAVGVAAAQYAAGGYEVIVDGIIGPWFLPHFVVAPGLDPADIQYIVLRPTQEVALERAVGRRDERDLVDPGPVSFMYDAFADLGSFEAHVVDTSSQEPQMTVDLLLDRINAGAFALS